MNSLHRIFEDFDLRTQLEKFFEQQAKDAMIASAEMMGRDDPRPELARKYACYAEAFKEAMNRLEIYAQKV